MRSPLCCSRCIVWYGDHLTIMIYRTAVAVEVVAALVLHRGAVTLLRQLEANHGVLWFDLGLPTARSTERWCGIGGWRVQRFIWSAEREPTGDDAILRCARVMRVASVAIGAALVVMLLAAAAQGWQHRQPRADRRTAPRASPSPVTHEAQTPGPLS